MKVFGFGVALMLVAAAASAQEQTSTVPAPFRVSLERDQHPVAGRIVGVVHNNSPFRVTDVRLAVQGFGADRQAVGQTLVWANGDIVPGGETSFSFEAMPEAISYRIGVVSYDIVSVPVPAARELR